MNDSSGRRVVRRIQDHSDTQRSLQEASVALENAFDHIRRVRRSLLRLTETFPEPLAIRSSNFNQDSVDPGHEALLLSGEHDDSTAATIGRELDGPTSVRRPRSPNANHPHSSMTVGPPTLVQQPPLPSVLPPRFSRQSADGPYTAATTHDLRVAAREATNLTTNHPTVSRLSLQATALEIEYERLLARRRIAHSVVQDSLYPNDSRFRSATRDRPDPSAVVPSSFPTSFPNMHPNLFDPAMPDPTNRLNYLPLPPVPLPGRPIQRPFGNLPGPPRPRPAIPTPADESVNDNTVLTEDQFMSWLLPSQEYPPSLVPRRDPHNPDTIRITRVNEPTPSHPDLQPRRRRGWARLDPDGNEIPSDEEEELERSRTDYRLRILQRAREDSNSPEILRHDGRTFHGSVLDSMLSVPVTQPRSDQWRSPTTDSRPFWVDPLPMPLSSMIMKVEHQDDYHPDVIVPGHACLAGR